MSSLLLLLSILGIHLLAVMSPGPDFIVAVKNSLRYGRVGGWRTAVGFGLGIAVHVTYCALGLALVISQSIIAFTIIKRLGAVYLIWLGAQSFFSKSGPVEIGGLVEKETKISWQKALAQGFWTNVLNPKATLFFLGLFSMVIAPSTPLWVLIAACVLMVVNTTLRFGFVSVLFTNQRIRSKIVKGQNYIAKILGGALIALGLKVALSD